jgi:NAD(P)-dependent dehydrogenase (short-subunit alcohol dehydrogenase family)
MQQKPPVLITGCSSGIGLCVARGLKREGFQVIASARRLQDVERLRTREQLDAVQLDLDSPASISAGLQAALEISGGSLYGLFNNGAYGQPGAVEDLSWDTLEAQLRTNLLGWHELTRQVIPVMRARGEGRIIQNSSVLGFAAMPYRGAYNCSKFALEGLSDTLRLELAGTGIFVSLVQPGPITSRFRENAYRKFLENIDRDHSAHRANYEAMESRLRKQGDTTAFTLPPEAVLKKVLHALRSRRPRPRYPVTIPTHLFGFLRRLLGTRQMDAILRKASGGGAR